MTEAEQIAQAFHEAYEALAPEHGYETREASAKPWAEVPEQNRGLMIATVQRLLDTNVIEHGGHEAYTWKDKMRDDTARVQDNPRFLGNL